MVTIDKAFYEDLKESDIILSHLYAFGVEDWEGYDLAMEEVEDFCG